jgi:TonB family protein
MKPTRCSSLLPSLLAIVLGLIFSGPAAASRANLDDLADQLGKGITKEKLRSVTVADFSAMDGKSSDLGWYLANRLSDSWLRQEQKFRVLDRAELKDAKVSADDLRSAEMLKRLGNVWGVDSIVTGVVDVLPDGYVVAASVRRVSNGEIILTASQSISHSRILDLLNPQGLDMGGMTAVRAGMNGVGVPVCLKCPIPQYSDKARKAGINATVVLVVIISTNGRSAGIGVVKDPGYGLTDQAIDTVSMWEFKAATDEDGKVVPVKVPIEVTFRRSPN